NLQLLVAIQRKENLPEIMPVFVSLPTGDTIAKQFAAEDTIADLKTWAGEQCGASPLGLAVFAAAGEALDDDATIATVATEGTTLDIQALLPGGKVHGSLARAGKVRGQTPKVAKQEKHKAKTGRAKRRIQYNKRFVATVNLPGGRRRGPNANS
uniref:40S ribosomal protein S30 n=2 Tax=Macrostomum lignano TaxID=282301 RepID=A0A1I8H726_9PLAT